MGIVAKYKFDHNIYADLIPEFNTEFTTYSVTDEVAEDGSYTIRTIESDSLPTEIRLGNSINPYVETSRELSLLEVLNMDTSGLTNCYKMFYGCKNVTKIECNWNTNNVIMFEGMFNYCLRLTTLDVSKFNTSKATTLKNMFRNCQSLITLDVSSFNTSQVTSISGVFGADDSIQNNFPSQLQKIIGLENWDTSNVTTMESAFWNCKNLTELDLSMWNTSKVDNIGYMFYCPLIKKFDISNWDMRKIGYTAGFLTSIYFAPTDIGMIYCNKETVNKMASLTPSSVNTTIWVGEDDITQYDQYDHITYKTQKVEDTVHLNSPLLKGDTIEVIDGKTYHVHRYEKTVLDGSENWVKPEIQPINTCRYLFVGHPNTLNTKIISDFKVKSNTSVDEVGVWCDTNTVLNVNLEINTIDKVKQWLSENPITIVYELQTPYYELISETPLNLTLPDTENNIVNNNSVLPSNMTIANKELSTIAIKPSTVYTLAFDKSIPTSNITIDICGSSQVTTTENMITLTTPSELGSGIRFLSTDGCVISNVRLLEGSLVESAIPKESFEGLKNSFEDGYLIGENLITTIVSETGGQTLRRDFSKNIYKNATVIIPPKYVGKLRVALCRDNYGWFNNYDITNEIQCFSCKTDEYYNCVSIAKADITLEELANLDIIVLEGDHTHLSEKELLQLIEKGTSHYTEEDWNNLGKYKVEYKVTGKNKCSKVIRNSNLQYLNIFHDELKIGTYTLSFETQTPYSGNSLYAYGNKYLSQVTNNNGKVSVTFNVDKNNIEAVNNKEYGYIWIYRANGDIDEPLNVQLEEGSTATSYEPYKEQIKTFYLNSPLLEGDTIEDVNGVATHVKRYRKVVLDGSDDEKYSVSSLSNQENTIVFTIPELVIGFGNKGMSDRFIRITDNQTDYEGISFINYIRFRILRSKLDTQNVAGFRKWLSENPMTVIYELTTPIYEPISTESILCDSYANGHLDLDSDIPVEKVSFREPCFTLKYLQPNTKYSIQFDSDNVGKMDAYYWFTKRISNINVVKGKNKFIYSTLDTIEEPKLYFDGIGFNASNIQVVADATHENGDVKEFDYFKGLKSTFEDKLITDENDEHYGQYAVDVKVVGKNKARKIENVNSINGTSVATNTISIDCDMKSKKTYTLSLNRTFPTQVSIYYYGTWAGQFQPNKNTVTFTAPYKTREFDKYGLSIYSNSVDLTITDDLNLQLEEGTQATPYEPYKESSYTIYLNSPLLKDDTIEVVDGKLSHVHRYGKVVLDGSETWRNHENNDTYISFILNAYTWNNNRKTICDKFLSEMWKNADNLREYIWSASGSCGICILKSKLSTQDLQGFKQWLQANPTTVVYELATPTVENIEPIQSGFVLSSVKEGDMTIDTALPIKVDLEYRTNMAGTSALEEQLANVQNGADLIDIINSEVDE